MVANALPLAARILAAALLLALPVPLLAQTTMPLNLVANGDFSQVADGQPANWRASGDPAHVTQSLLAVKDANGVPYAQLVCTRCETKTTSSHAMLAQVGQVKLTRGRIYEFSCRMRAEGIAGRTVDVTMSDMKDWSQSGLWIGFPVTRSWRTCRTTFVASRDVGPTGRLQIWFEEPGTLCVADVRIVECPQQQVDYTDVVATAGRNLVPNGSFEVGSPGWSSLGAGGGSDLEQLHGSIEAGGASDGRRFLRIPLGEGRTPLLYSDYYQSTERRELRPLAASRGWIPVEKGAAYTLSCFLRAGTDGTPATIGARSRQPGAWWKDYKITVKLSTS